MLERKRELRDLYRDGLLDDTVPFWLQHCLDSEYGGFMTSLDRQGNLVDTDKGVWQQGRFTWLLGELYNQVEPRSDWLDAARSGAQFLDEHCYDPTDGRMWFHVTRDGKPIRKRRYAFSESFAAIAYGELFQATGESRFRDPAEEAFRRFLVHHQTPAEHPKYTSTRPLKSLGFPMITIATAQELRESIQFAEADRWIDWAIDEIRRCHLKPEIECVMETVGADGELVDHFDGRLLNPGHAIEGAWFIMREGKGRNDRELIDTGCQMLDWMWQRGWDSEHGGILYFADVKGLPIQEYWHDMKFWWPQNETIIATLLAFQITGNSKYAQWHQQIHDWSYAHFPDAEHGEWFGYLHRDGRLSSSLKGGLWKGPFHLPRMQLECWRILDDIA